MKLNLSGSGGGQKGMIDIIEKVVFFTKRKI